MRVYIAGRLTSADNYKELIEFYERIGTLCKQLEINFYLPHKHVRINKKEEVTPKEIYTRCKRHILESDLIIACMNSPSHGVGAELEIANAKGIPIVLIHCAWIEVSHMILGMSNVVEDLYYVYKDEGMKKLEEYLEKFV
jgi:nucleoside 2-deoxyribosyltransferase